MQLTQLEIGSDFDARYRVLRCLKSGGMGSVYEVLDATTDRLRALKVMLPQIADDEDMRARFLQEASVVGRVCSDHVVEVVDAGIGGDGDTPFLVMELLRGEDFGALLEKGALRPKRVVTALTQAALGLDRVHAEGIIHRDLKPENLFHTTRDDGGMCLKILDFGVAKVVDHLATLRTTRSLGTPLYMAPEQLTGEATITTAADLYSLAQVAFCLLVGKPYWFEEAKRASSAYTFVNTVVAGVSEPPSVRAKRFAVTLPAAFDPWFAKATASCVDHRFESATEQIDALAVALLEEHHDVVEEPPASAPTREETPMASVHQRAPTTHSWPRSWSPAWLWLGGVAIIVGAVTVFAGDGDGDGAGDPTATPGTVASAASAASGLAASAAVAPAVRSSPSSAAEEERSSSLAVSSATVPVRQRRPLGGLRTGPTLPRPTSAKPPSPAAAKPTASASASSAPLSPELEALIKEFHAETIKNWENER